MDPKNPNVFLLKRKHQSLTIQEKVEMLNKLDLGVSVRKLCAIYGIGSSTVYDIKKHRDKIFRFYENSDSKVQMNLRKTIKDGKSREHEVRMMEWLRRRRKDGVDVTGVMIKDEAKMLHEELGLNNRCEYGDGWLKRFKKIHGGLVLQKNGTNWLANPEKVEEEQDEYDDDDENVCKDNNYNNNNYAGEFAEDLDDRDQLGCTTSIDNTETRERAYNLRCFSRKTSTTETEAEEEMPEDLTKKNSKVNPSKTTKKRKDINVFSSSSVYSTHHTDIPSTQGSSKHLIKGKCKLKSLKKRDKVGDANDHENQEEEGEDTWTSSTYGDEETVTHGLYNNNNDPNPSTNSEMIDVIMLKSDRKIKENNDDVCYNNNNNNNIDNNNEIEEEEEEEEGKLSIETLIELLATLIKGLESQSFVTEEELTNFYLMYEKLQRERSKRIQKVRLHEMFQRMTRFMYNRQQTTVDSRLTDPAENPVASTSSTNPGGGIYFQPPPGTQDEEEIREHKLDKSYYYSQS